ncbi:hypothetical protein J5N97_014508 [Dioscorea zingiberensis]|uniref:PWWP domain-containing protein n=1 Tax=Dioscorea zingiberensis TaxID=325984 RepID=A0A9D5CUA2_9LILI|nr:hypothetical protein J5N97_014508 [Dioscorea zingiberensis]
MVLLVCESKVSKKKVDVYMDSRAHHSSQSSQLVGFKEGDLVWAKAFPYTWWPGSITRIMRSSVFVSFFGCDRAKCFDLPEIRGFEEAFPRISKMVRMKLSDEIDLALEELSRKATSGMMCYCRTLDLNQCVNENKGFKPKEMLGFVLDAAIDIQVGVFNLATAVRVSAQLGAYRHFVSACQYVDLSGGFDPDCVLDFVLRMAVSPSNFGEESHGFAEAVRQVNAYRHFVLVHPGWRYRQNLELEVDSLRNEFDWLEESSSSDISELSEDRSVSDICEDVQNIDHVSPWSMSLTASEGENAKGQDENAADAKHIPNYMALLPLSSYHISLPKNTPCLERLPVFLANQCDAHSADSMLMSSVKSQSSDKLSLTVNYNIENQVNMMDVIPGSSSFIQTGTQDAFKTMKIDELDFSVNSYKLQRTLSPYTKDMADDNSLTADQRFASYKTHSSEATIDANQVDGNGPTLEGHTSNALKFHSGGVVCIRNMTKIDKMEVSCSLTSPVCVSRGISCRKKELELPKFPSSSDWRPILCVPLTPDVSNPGSEAKKPLVISKQKEL